MSHSQPEQSPSIIQRGLGDALDALGMSQTLEASVGRIAAKTAISSVTTAAELAVTIFNNNVRDQSIKNAKHLLEKLTETISNDPGKWSLSSLQQEAFQSFFQKAVSEDDDQKLSIYSSLFQWIQIDHPSPSLIRMMGDAIRQLTFFELRTFVHWGSDSGRLATEAGGISDNVIWNRLDAWGLTTGGSIRSTTNVSTIGRALIKHCHFLSFSEAELKKLGVRF